MPLLRVKQARSVVAARKERDSQVARPSGYIAHSCAFRTRLSLPELKGKDGPLTALCDAVLELDGVRQVEARLLTGSLIIQHDGAAGELVRQIEKAGLLRIRSEAWEHGPAVEAQAWKDQIDGFLEASLGKGLDIKSVAALALFAMALRQIAAGHVFPPATTALWYGMNLLVMSAANRFGPTEKGEI